MLFTFFAWLTIANLTKRVLFPTSLFWATPPALYGLFIDDWAVKILAFSIALGILAWGYAFRQERKRYGLITAEELAVSETSENSTGRAD